MIYFIRAGRDDNGPIKIGYCESNPIERLCMLQTGDPSKLYLIGTIDGDMGDEKALHRKFKNYRLMGEWFSASSELRDFISRECSDPSGAIEMASPNILEGNDNFNLDQFLREVEFKFIDKAITMAGDNHSKAAKILGITFRSFRYRLSGR